MILACPSTALWTSPSCCLGVVVDINRPSVLVLSLLPARRKGVGCPSTALWMSPSCCLGVVVDINRQSVLVLSLLPARRKVVG